jgi:hypothetical protein
VGGGIYSIEFYHLLIRKKKWLQQHKFCQSLALPHNVNHLNVLMNFLIAVLKKSFHPIPINIVCLQFLVVV